MQKKKQNYGQSSVEARIFDGPTALHFLLTPTEKPTAVFTVKDDSFATSRLLSCCESRRNKGVGAGANVPPQWIRLWVAANQPSATEGLYLLDDVFVTLVLS